MSMESGNEVLDDDWILQGCISHKTDGTGESGPCGGRDLFIQEAEDCRT